MSLHFFFLILFFPRPGLLTYQCSLLGYPKGKKPEISVRLFIRLKQRNKNNKIKIVGEEEEDRVGNLEC
jgi:hypothetical protein